jgi:fatty-acyl-CoA synthase
MDEFMQAPADRPHFRWWPKRVPHGIPPAQTTLWDNLAITARRYPDRDAYLFLGGRITWAGVHERAEALAGWLVEEAGVAPGDRVVLCMQNSPQYAIAFYAILRARAVVVPVNPMTRADELPHYVEDPQARVAIIAADLLPEFERAQAGLPADARLATVLVTRYLDHADPASLPPDEQPPAAWRPWLEADPVLPGWARRWTDALAAGHRPPAHAGEPDDLVALCYTSGTTGKPKGCMHSHRTIGHNVMASPLWANASAADVTFGVVPMFHITGMLFGLHVPVYLGQTVVQLPRWDRELAGLLISRHRVTGWVNIPTMIIDLLASPNFASFDLSSLRSISGGGAAMPAAIAERLKAQYGLAYAEGYGLTETAAPSHSNPPDDPRLQCLGVPYVGVDSRVIDPETLAEVPVGEQGEIIVRGPQVFLGYWGRPADTEAAFVEFEGRRYLRTGDLGRVDEDGYFYITDRLKRMINASGFKVWPAEVEAMFYKHPDVQEACIIATHDAYRGESVKLVAVLRPQAVGRVDAAALIAWAREHMAAYKVPREVEFVDVLPKSGSGKVLWRVLQAQEKERRQAARPEA